VPIANPLPDLESKHSADVLEDLFPRDCARGAVRRPRER